MSERHTILIIDDDKSLRDMFGNALDRFGFKPILRPNGTEGLQALDDMPEVAVVLLDWMMPGMDGLEVTQRILQRENPPPIIMMSAKSRREDVMQAIAAGVQDYVAKPVHIGDLMLRINRLIEQHGDPEQENETYIGFPARSALTVVDVSQTGLCLESFFSVERGSVIMVSAVELSRRLDLPLDTTFAIRVANCQKAGRHYRIGGEFIGHDVDLERRIRQASLAAGGFRANP